MSKHLRVADYLGHILQAMERIERYTSGLDEAGFLNSEMVQDVRNRVAHGYDQVDLEIVWKTVRRDLPVLYRQVRALAMAG